MSKKYMMLFIIAVVGALAALISFAIALSKSDIIAAIAFGAAGLLCINNAINSSVVMKNNK